MNNDSIRVFNLTFDKKFRDSFMDGTKQIFDEGFLGNHTFVRKFENNFIKKTKSKYAIAVPNGTMAIELPLRAVGVKGKDVLLGTNTFIATASAIRNAGGNPVAIDIEDKYFSLSPERLEENISSEVGAVVIVHISGLVTPRIEEIKKICDKYNVPLIEDAAQAFGSSFNNIDVGNFGLAGAFSFQTTKVMTTGEGGMVTTNDESFYKTMKSIGLYGVDFNNKLEHIQDGTNFKISEFVGLLGVCELDRVDDRIAKRQLLAKQYQDNLKDTKWIALKAPENTISSHYKQVILSPIPIIEIEKEFKKFNVSLTGGVYNVPIHRQPLYKSKYKDNDFPISNYFSENHFCPPCYPELDIKDIDKICDILLNLKK